MNELTATPRDRWTVEFSLLVVRVAAGAIMAAHGAHKVLGWWGGPGLENFVPAFAEKMDVPTAIAYLVAFGEFLGGLAMIVGLLSRFSALSNIVIMVGAIAMVHAANGFFMANGGFEYNAALIGLMVPTFLAGPGRISLSGCLPIPKVLE